MAIPLCRTPQNVSPWTIDEQTIEHGRDGRELGGDMLPQ